MIRWWPIQPTPHYPSPSTLAIVLFNLDRSVYMALTRSCFLACLLSVNLCELRQVVADSVIYGHITSYIIYRRRQYVKAPWLTPKKWEQICSPINYNQVDTRTAVSATYFPHWHKITKFCFLDIKIMFNCVVPPNLLMRLAVGQFISFGALIYMCYNKLKLCLKFCFDILSVIHLRLMNFDICLLQYLSSPTLFLMFKQLEKVLFLMQ